MEDASTGIATNESKFSPNKFPSISLALPPSLPSPDEYLQISSTLNKGDSESRNLHSAAQYARSCSYCYIKHRLWPFIGFHQLRFFHLRPPRGPCIPQVTRSKPSRTCKFQERVNYFVEFVLRESWFGSLFAINRANRPSNPAFSITMIITIHIITGLDLRSKALAATQLTLKAYGTSQTLLKRFASTLGFDIAFPGRLECICYPRYLGNVS